MFTNHPMFNPLPPSTARQTIVPRCWADGSTWKAGIKPSECMAIGDAALGLCKKHALEILGREECLATT